MDDVAYIYFVQAQTLGLIKIGFAVDLEARLSAVRCSSPDGVSLLGVCRVSPLTVRQAEGALHAKFAHLRDHGEWFRPERELLMFIDDFAEAYSPDVLPPRLVEDRTPQPIKMELPAAAPPAKPKPIKGGRKALLAAYKEARGIT